MDTNIFYGTLMGFVFDYPHNVTNQYLNGIRQCRSLHSQPNFQPADCDALTSSWRASPLNNIICHAKENDGQIIGCEADLGSLIYNMAAGAMQPTDELRDVF